MHAWRGGTFTFSVTTVTKGILASSNRLVNMQKMPEFLARSAVERQITGHVLVPPVNGNVQVA